MLPTTGTVSGLQMTQDINFALDTLNTLSAGASAPGSPEAGQLWHDTTANILKIRSLDNTTWISLFSLNESTYAASLTNLTNLAFVTPTRTTTPTANTASSQLADMNAVQQSQTGGYVNKFRNATFDIWQRGTSGSITAGTPAYTADGWIVSCAGANISWAQNANATNSYPLYGLKLTGAASVTDVLLKQRIESCVAAPLAGLQVTVQFAVYNSTGGAITPTLTVKHATATDNWTSSTTDVSAVSLSSCANSALTVVSYTFAASASSLNGLEVTIDFGNNLSSGTKYVQVFAADIRATPGVAAGINSAPSIIEQRPLPLELQFCQRYYFNLGAASGAASSGAAFQAGINFPTTMRATPTASQAVVATAIQYTSGSSTQSATNITLSNADNYGGRGIWGNMSGLSANSMASMSGNGGQGIAQFSAEL